VTKQLTLDLIGRVNSYDFTCGSDPNNANLRNDYLFSVSPALTYSFTPNLSVNAAYVIELGRNFQDNPPGGAEYREFNHNVASLALTYKF
jgi:long-subunit fatty acid transport protein